ncbi:fused MFS/spermidine synthase [Megalodesulfovibrio paquesii]
MTSLSDLPESPTPADTSESAESLDLMASSAAFDPSPTVSLFSTLLQRLRPGGGPALYAACFCAGVSSLMFETLWVRMLARYLGSTFTATALVLGAFLAGLSLGALAAGLFADRVRKPLAVFSGLQVMVALLSCFSSLIAVDIWGNWFVTNAALRGMTPMTMLWSRIACAAASVMPASFLMGMALPILVSACSARMGWQRGFGRFYAWNALGAVFGAWWAGFVFLGWLGESGMAFVAALGNLAAAGLAQLPTPIIRTPQEIAEAIARRRTTRTPAPLYLPFQRRMALTGLMAGGAIFLALQALWVRLLLLPLQTGTYSFSAMMATSLLGAGMGSWVSTRSGLALRRPLASLGLGLAAMGALAAWGLGSFGAALMASNGFADGGVSSVAFWLTFPAALCFGWLLPTGARACLLFPDAPGEETGRLYTVNTIGAILGAGLGAALLAPQLGAVHGVQLCCLLALAAGGMILAVAPREEGRKLLWAVPLCVVALIWGLGRAGDPIAEAMTLRTRALVGPKLDMYAALEGADATVVVAGSPENSRDRVLIRNGRDVLRAGVNGTPAGLPGLLVRLPMAMVEFPRRILLVNLGTGDALQAAVQWPVPPTGVVVADPVPGIFNTLQFFQTNATELLTLETVATSARDGRSHLQMNAQRHDIIAISLARPLWNRDSISLLTENFFDLCKERLTSNGVLALEIPPTNPRALGMILATVARSFPGIAVWKEPASDALLVVAAKRPFQYLDEDLPRISARLSLLARERLGGAAPAPEIFAGLFLARDDALRPLLVKFPVLTDRRSRLDFPLQFSKDGNFLDLGPKLSGANFAAALAAGTLADAPPAPSAPSHEHGAGSASGNETGDLTTLP